MIVKVRCYGPARRAAGAETVEFEAPDGARIDEVIARLAAVDAALAELIPTCAVAVGDRIVQPDETLDPGDAHDVALLPPVAGGCR